MLLDLRRVFEGDDQTVPFAHQMDLSQIEQWGDRPFAEPVQLEGYVQNRAGIVTVHYTASYLLSTACARCLDPVERRVRQDFDHTVVRKLNQQEDDDHIVCEDGILDLDLIAQDDILLELPIRMLCSEDCKGLCPMCGCNLNREQCSCQQPEWEPQGRTVRPFADLEWSDEE